MEDVVWVEACEELKPLLLDKTFIKPKKRNIGEPLRRYREVV